MFKSRRTEPLFVSAEALFELEQELAEPLFMGVPIGSTLGGLFGLELLCGQGKWDLKSVNLDRLRYWYHYFRGLRLTPKQEISDTGRIIITWSNEKPYNRDLILPLLKGLGASRCLIIGKTSSMESQLPIGTEFLLWENLPSIDLKTWRKNYSLCKPIWHGKLREWIRRQGITQEVFPRLVDTMLVQSQKVMVSANLLNQIQPSVVVVEHDRHIDQAPLVLTCKFLGIPTMTMIHGVISSSYGYVPLLADLAFCWGERHRQQMIEMGTPPERLVITGCQRLTPNLTMNSAVARRKVGLPPEKPLVLLATNPIYSEYRKKLVNTFCEGLTACKDISAVVRLHPSERLDFYAKERAMFPSVQFQNNDEWTLDEALAASDVIFCHDSGFGNDALVKGKPVIVMDVLPVPLGNGKELVEQAGCPYIRNSVELAKVLHLALSDSSFRQELSDRTRSYLGRFCAAKRRYGDDVNRWHVHEITT